MNEISKTIKIDFDILDGWVQSQLRAYWGLRFNRNFNSATNISYWITDDEHAPGFIELVKGGKDITHVTIDSQRYEKLLPGLRATQAEIDSIKPASYIFPLFEHILLDYKHMISNVEDISGQPSVHAPVDSKMFRKKPGRRIESQNLSAYNIWKEGDYSEQARRLAFEHWCERKSIDRPTKFDWKSFKSAMHRRKKADLDSN